MADGSCTAQTQPGCYGIWTVGSVCSPNPCPKPVTVGACCFRNAYCRILPVASCTMLRGIFMSATVCTANPTTPCYVLGNKSGDQLPDDNAPAKQKDSWGQIKNRYR